MRMYIDRVTKCQEDNFGQHSKISIFVLNSTKILSKHFKKQVNKQNTDVGTFSMFSRLDLRFFVRIFSYLFYKPIFFWKLPLTDH